MNISFINFIEKHPGRTVLYAIGIVFTFFLLISYCFETTSRFNFEVIFFYYIGSLLITICVLLLALAQARNAIEQLRINNLIDIDKRWSSQEIIKARQIIHKLYLAAKNTNISLTEEDISSNTLNVLIGQQILQLSKQEKPECVNEFIYLLNFLDFLETIGYLHLKKNSLDLDDVTDLMGNSIVYFYEIFEIYIFRRRKKDEKFYIKFEQLYLKVREKNLQDEGGKCI